VLGYFVDVTAQHGEKLLAAPLNATFIHRQTLAGQVRFTTTELAALEAKIATAAERASPWSSPSSTASRRWSPMPLVSSSRPPKRSPFSTSRPRWRRSRAERDYVRPEVDRSLDFLIQGGRHPVVEQALARDGAPFVANDCELSPPAGAGATYLRHHRPNMAGKSTYLRKNALIAVLAQCGQLRAGEAGEIG